MEATEKKKYDFKTILLIVLLPSSMLGIFIGWCFQKCDYKELGYFIVLICSVIFGNCILCLLIKPSIDKSKFSYEIRRLSSFGTNILFFIFPRMFDLIDTINLNKYFVLISTLLSFILTFIFLCKFIKINKGDDISLLKATNLFIAFIFTAIQQLIRDNSLIGYYVILPLTLTRALYEFFTVKVSNKATPIQSQEEQK
jgi:hypothetical protein